MSWKLISLKLVSYISEVFLLKQNILSRFNKSHDLMQILRYINALNKLLFLRKKKKTS